MLAMTFQFQNKETFWGVRKKLEKGIRTCPSATARSTTHDEAVSLVRRQPTTHQNHFPILDDNKFFSHEIDEHPDTIPPPADSHENTYHKTNPCHMDHSHFRHVCLRLQSKLEFWDQMLQNENKLHLNIVTRPTRSQNHESNKRSSSTPVQTDSLQDKSFTKQKTIHLSTADHLKLKLRTHILTGQCVKFESLFPEKIGRHPLTPFRSTNQRPHITKCINTINLDTNGAYIICSLQILQTVTEGRGNEVRTIEMAQMTHCVPVCPALRSTRRLIKVGNRNEVRKIYALISLPARVITIVLRPDVPIQRPIAGEQNCLTTLHYKICVKRY